MPYATLGSKRINYTDFKPESGHPRETFVFTHGLGSSQNYYFPIIPAFVKQNFRCIAFDTTGAGRSPYTQVEQSVDTLSSDIIALMDSLQVEKAVVVAHSMGGIIAANLAATHGDRIVASVWIGPVYPSSAVAEVFAKRIEVVEEKGMEAMANSIPQAAVGSKASPLAKAMIRELLIGQDARGYVSNCRVIAQAKVPDYGKIKVPILLLAGEEDRSAPLEGCKKMFNEIGTEDKRMEILDGIGHWHCLEAFDEVSKHILDFYHEIQ